VKGLKTCKTEKAHKTPKRPDTSSLELSKVGTYKTIRYEHPKTGTCEHVRSMKAKRPRPYLNWTMFFSRQNSSDTEFFKMYYTLIFF
jgi:hypothetical protein